MRKILSIVAILAVAILCQPDALFASSDRTIEKSIPVKSGGKLEIDLRSGGGINISGWSKEEVAVTTEIGGDDADKVDVEFTPESSGLGIHSSCRKHRCRCDLLFTIKVPAKFDIEIHSNGGGVAITGVEGRIGGQTMGGPLELARIKGQVHLKTMGGAVTVEGAEADGEVSTMGGDVLIQDVNGSLKGHTMGGTVTYKNASGRSSQSADTSTDREVRVSSMGGDIETDQAGEKVNAETMGGNVTVTRAEEANVTTMGGDIHIDEAPAGARATTMGGDIKIGSAGQFVKAKTMGGNIRVDAVDGWVEASTMGGNVTVTMVGDPTKGRRDVDLSSMGGDITLVVPAGLSMRFDIDIKYTKSGREHPRIESDFDMKIEETPEWEGHWWGQAYKHIRGTGAVGGGEHLIKIRTIDGNVYVKKG